MDDFLNKIITKIIDRIGSPASLLVHTIIILCILSLRLFGSRLEDVMLILTTVLSVEAIYLVLLSQITLNRHTKSLKDVDTHVEELQTEVEEALELDQ